MSSRITYENKQAIQNDENVARKNKVTDLDLNEIKKAVNAHADDIEAIQTEQTSQTTAINRNARQIGKINEDINSKVDKQEGKDLSTNDFTDTYKQKLDNLENYDDTEIKQKYNELQQENIELKKTQDDMIEKSLNKETEADTTLVVKDTDEFYGKLSIYGGHRQEKREGYNKLPITATTQTSNGVTFTVNDDGTILANGTATANAVLRLYTGDNIFNGLTLSGCPKTNTQTIFISADFFDDTWNYKEYIADYGDGVLLNSSYTKSTVELRIANGTTVNNLVFKPMVAEAGKEYEQFGVMPSLQYPSEIEVVGDNIQLFKSIDTATRSGITFTNNGDGSYTLNGTSTKDTSFYVTNLEYEAGTYTLSANNSIANSSVAMQLETSTGNKRFALSDINSHKTYEVDDINVLSIIVASGTTLNDYVICPKLEKGSKATSLSKFGQGSVEITTSNKNLYNQEKFIQGIWNTNEATRTVGWIGKVEAGQKIVVKRYNSKYEYLLGITTMNYRNSANVLLLNNGWRTTEKTEMTATADGYLFLQIRKNDNSNITSAELLANDFQVEFDEETSFVEHKGKTHIMPIQQKMFEGDTFENIDGVWYEKHDKGEYVMDGVNNKFTYFNNTNNSLKIEIEDSIKSNGYFEAQKNLFLMCTHFIQGNTQAYFQSGMVVYWDVQGALYVKFEEGEFTGLTQANDWLKEQYDAGTPVIIAYQRVTPKLLKCTDEQSKILDKIDTYRNGTIITTDNDLCKIKLRYKQSLEAAIKEYTATTVAESEE